MYGNQKDIKKSDRNNKESYLSNKTDTILTDNVNYFVLKKGEKLTAALHLITSFIHVKEPVRERLRFLSIEILSFITQQSISGGEANEESELCALVEELCSLLSVAELSGYVSAMNSEVLIREYRDLLSVFVSEDGQHIGSRREQKFSPEFFSVNDLTSSGNKKIPSSGVKALHGGYNKGLFKGHIFEEGNSMRKTTLSDVNSSGHKTPRNKGLKKDRRSLIVSKVRQKGSVSMKDLSDMTENCSEKTLQRELISLVREGVLKKEGERRWSTYMLV